MLYVTLYKSLTNYDIRLNDLIVWMNTVKHSKYLDTNKIFEESNGSIQIRNKQDSLYKMVIKKLNLW